MKHDTLKAACDAAIARLPEIARASVKAYCGCNQGNRDAMPIIQVTAIGPAGDQYQEETRIYSLPNLSQDPNRRREQIRAVGAVAAKANSMPVIASFLFERVSCPLGIGTSPFPCGGLGIISSASYPSRTILELAARRKICGID